MKCKFHVGDLVIVVSNISYRTGFIGYITEISGNEVALEARDKGKWHTETFRTYLEWIDFYNDENEEEEISIQDLSTLF